MQLGRTIAWSVAWRTWDASVNGMWEPNFAHVSRLTDQKKTNKDQTHKIEGSKRKNEDQKK